MKRIATALIAFAVLIPAASFAEKYPYRTLPLEDPPCLFLLDEETGKPTGNPVNPPCKLGASTQREGDPVDPALREQFGRAATAAGETTGKAVAPDR